MRYRVLVFLFFLPLGLAAQRKIVTKTTNITAREALMSSDAAVMAAYIRANPNDPEIPALRSRILELLKPARDAAAKAKIQPLTPAAVKKETAPIPNPAPEKENVASAPVDAAPAPSSLKNPAPKPATPPKISADQAAKMVNHILNGSKNSREAVIQITNNSSCDLLVRISGKQFYNLTVPAHGRNYVMVDKGTYDLTTSVCDARYSSKKVISQDLMLTLSR